MAAKTLAHDGSKIAENTVSLAVSGAAGLVFTVIQLGLLSRFLPGDIFGFFVALRGFSLLISTVLLVGLPQVLIRYLPSFQTRGDRWRALWLFVVSTFTVLALGGLLYLGTDWWRGWMPEAMHPLVGGREITLWMLMRSLSIQVSLVTVSILNALILPT